MYTDKLRQVADAIENHAKLGVKFDMDVFLEPVSTIAHTCGTVGCIGGFTLLELDPERAEYEVNSFKGYVAPKPEWLYPSGGMKLSRSERAGELLGLTYVQAKHLFFGTDTKVTFELINYNAARVPEALRWMADNQVISWDGAVTAAGFVNTSGCLINPYDEETFAELGGE